MKYFLQTAWQAAELWYDKDADHMAATVSYYALFAVTPLLLLTVTIIGLVYGKDFVIEALYEWGSVMGPDVVTLLHEAVRNLEVISDGFGVPIVGALFFSGMVIVMFNTFTTGLHHLWDIPHQGVRGWIKKSLHSMVFVLFLEIYLLSLIGLDAVVTSLITMTGVPMLAFVEPLFFIITTMILFSVAYALLPWEALLVRSRLVGAFVASVLFALAKVIVAFYIFTTPVPGLFGAAGIVLVLLIWIYVSTAILYYGAAFAFVHDKRSQKVLEA